MFCNCRACRAAKRKGLVLGSRRMGYFSNGIFGWSQVSDYIPYFKFMKGRKHIRSWSKKDKNTQD